jgi:hypothetical protein
MSIKYVKCHKTDEIPIKYTNSVHCQTLQNLPKLGFLVWKYTIWHPWREGVKRIEWDVCKATKKRLKTMRNHEQRMTKHFFITCKLLEHHLKVFSFPYEWEWLKSRFNSIPAKIHSKGISDWNQFSMIRHRKKRIASFSRWKQPPYSISRHVRFRLSQAKSAC